MAEELRFFLRTALYSAVLAVIYWFASFDPRTGEYDWAGTALLAFVVLSASVIVAVVAGLVRATRSELLPPGSPLVRGARFANRLVGFDEDTEEAQPRPLAGGPTVYPRRSGWPLLAGFAALLVGAGLVFGEWLIVPGIAIGALAGWGWLTELDRPR